MEISALLAGRFPRLVLEKNFSFARHTTIGCGGSAAVCAYPQGDGEAEALLRFLLRENIPYVFLGAGANTLPDDGYFEGVAVRFCRMRSLVYADNRLIAEGGVTGGALCRFARQNGVSGYAPFTGIPMTVGGGVVMNAGVSAAHFSDRVLRVFGIEKGKICTFLPNECKFGEKTSLFQSGVAVLRVELRAEKAPPLQIADETEQFRLARMHLPKGRSMGCTFVNPAGESAGAIIERCALKGMKIGGARISEEHANFIINEGGTSADVARLIDAVREAVYKQTGIRLREEIRRLKFTT